MALLWRLVELSSLVVFSRATGAESSAAAGSSVEETGQVEDVSAPANASKKSRMRDTCAPELDLILEEKETFKTYAKNAQKFCNATSPFVDEHLEVREVLGFVGPWSDHGYRAGKHFRGKLTYSSPLWFRILPGQKDLFDIAGWDIADEQARWQEQAGAEFCIEQRCGDGPSMLPHFSIEGFADFKKLKALLESPRDLAAEIAVTCDRGKFQGIVLDVRLALFPSFKTLLPALVKEIAQALHVAHRKFYLSVPVPYPDDDLAYRVDFTRNDAAAVAKYVDAFVIGTRDFARTTPGPSAPLPWVRNAVTRLLADSSDGQVGLRADQLLIEIPMYGRAFKEGEPDGKIILIGEIVKAMAKQRPKVVWDSEAEEHYANLTKSHVYLSFPTLAFVRARLRLARSLGVGVALRELGGGFDAAFDLLSARAEEPKSHDPASAAAKEPSSEL